MTPTRHDEWGRRGVQNPMGDSVGLGRSSVDPTSRFGLRSSHGSVRSKRSHCSPAVKVIALPCRIHFVSGLKFPSSTLAMTRHQR